MYTAAQMNYAIVDAYFDEDQTAQFQSREFEAWGDGPASSFSLTSLVAKLTSWLPERQPATSTATCATPAGCA